MPGTLTVYVVTAEGCTVSLPGPHGTRGPKGLRVSSEQVEVEGVDGARQPVRLGPLAPALLVVHIGVGGAVERLVRARGFRTQVLAAYGWRCAVTGWQATAGLASGLLDAAHLTAVERGGRDDVRNGVSLTPTIHRLYDAGALGFQVTPAGLILRTGADGVVLRGQGGTLDLRDGLRLLMPGDRRLWPAV